jgi:hypothetical protein
MRTEPEQTKRVGEGSAEFTSAEGGGAWRPRGTALSSGVSLALLAALSIAASGLGRLLSPALPGSATGLETWIHRTNSVAAFMSQMVAAGGIAFALRAVGVAMNKSALGLTYRLVMFPATIVTSALVIGAAGRVLTPEQNGTLAVSVLAAAALTTPLALHLPETRAIGIALGLTFASSSFDFAAKRLALDAAETASHVLYARATKLATMALVLEVALVATALIWLSRRVKGRALLLSGLSIGVTIVIAWVLRLQVSGDAATAQVILARAAGELLRGPHPLAPAALRLTIEIAGLVTAVTALVLSRRVPIAPVLSLCLVSQGSVDMPLPALLLMVASVAIPARLFAESQVRVQAETP